MTSHWQNIAKLYLPLILGSVIIWPITGNKHVILIKTTALVKFVPQALGLDPHET